MNPLQYRITFDGELMPGMHPDTVRDNLARLFKSDRSRVDRLFAKGPVVLKRALQHDEAERYLQALQQAGVRVRKEREGLDNPARPGITAPAAALSPPPVATLLGMDCPKCGHHQPRGAECRACGIIIDRFLARQAQLPQENQARIAPLSPYAAPGAPLEDSQPAHGELRVFSLQGRIGRLRYLAWTTVLLLAAMPLLLVCVLTMNLSTILGFLLMIAAGTGFLVVSVQICVQRLHDIGWSGWLYLLCLVPAVGWIVSLLLIAMPGNPGDNRYGPPQPPNTLAVKILAGLFLVVTLGGALLASSLSAYLEAGLSSSP